VPSLTESDNSSPRLIKRYANRKLYDTEASCYVTLHEIAGMVREGEDVKIIDNNSKDDITNVTLAQIIYEEEKKGGGESRRARSLRDFIQEGRNRLMTSLRDGPISKFVPRHDGDHDPQADGADEGEDEGEGRSSEGRLFGVSSPREAWDELQRIADTRMRTLLGGALGHVQQLQSEVKRLRSRIEELEGRLSERVPSRRSGSDSGSDQR